MSSNPSSGFRCNGFGDAAIASGRCTGHGASILQDAAELPRVEDHSVAGSGLGSLIAITHHCRTDNKTTSASMQTISWDS